MPTEETLNMATDNAVIDKDILTAPDKTVYIEKSPGALCPFY